MIDPDFMRLAEEIAKPFWDEILEKRRLRIDKWNKENPETLKRCQKEYDKSKKGMIANKRKNCTRNRRYRESCKNLTHEDLENIKNFYVNCPKGYEVDHIIPISKGGEHKLSNLQYLTPTENRRKGNRI